MVATSYFSGKRINRFTHIHQSTEDLLKKVKMLRMISRKTGTYFQSYVGFDAANAIYSTTFEVDQKLGRNYHKKRFINFLRYWQENNLMVVGAP